MATALDIITRAMRLIGQLPAGEDPSAEESADGLVVLNELLASFSNEEGLVYQIQTETFTWPGGSASRTIGSSGNFNTARPVRIDESSFIRTSSQDYRLRVLTDHEYNAIVEKSATGTLPYAIYGDRAFPLMNLYLLTVPTANVELHLASWKALTEFAALTTEVSLPPGYNRMLRTNLACELAPEYGVEPPPQLQRMAAKSRAVLKPTNDKRETMEFPAGMPGRSVYRGNILTGE
jgi:hypothetical protein